MSLILASRSPQRRAILEQLGIDFTVVAPEVEEIGEGEPEALVRENALRKARAVEGDRVLGVDTAVALDVRVFGKPRGYELRADGVPQIGPSAAHLLRCKVASEIRSSCAGKLPGTVPKGWRVWADELLEPRIDWRRALAAAVRTGFASVAGCVDYSYMRPSRRASVMGSVVMPAMRKPLPTVAVVIDTSRSMSDLHADALAEVDGILRGIGVGRDRLHVLSCDVQVHRIQRVTSSRQVELYGGGGTDMGAGIASALQLKPRPSVIVVLTDGYTPWPVRAPNAARVVVGMIGAGKWEVPAWAKLVRIEPEP